MSRQEDFREMSKDLHVQFLSNPWTIYETGCEDGYQYAIDKVCEWLQENLYVLRTFRDPRVNKYEIFIRMLRKAMED